MMPEPIEVFPPPWFMENLNRTRFNEGLPTLSMFDPIAMAVWHMVSRPPPPMSLVVVTGC